MRSITFARSVGTAPGTTTISLGLTEQEFQLEMLRLRQEEIRVQRIASLASATLTGLMILAVTLTWVKTGRLIAPGPRI